jgi:hypothetical protein
MNCRIMVWTAVWIALFLGPYIYAVNDLVAWP